MPPEPVPYKITTGAVGGRLVIDGEDVTDRVDAFGLRVGRTEPTVLSLHLIPGAGDIEGEGLVHVVADPRDEADIICEFLAQIDPGMLEADVLQRNDVGGSFTGPMLEQLAAYARGGL